MLQINLKIIYKFISNSKIPYTHNESLKFLRNFIEDRFKEFGDYEDAILEKELFKSQYFISYVECRIINSRCFN